MQVITRYVRDLNDDERSALERVVGHALSETEQVTIQVTGPAGTLSTNGETVAGDRLPPWCNVYQDLTAEQIDDLDRSIVRVSSSRDV